MMSDWGWGAFSWTMYLGMIVFWVGIIVLVDLGGQKPGGRWGGANGATVDARDRCGCAEEALCSGRDRHCRVRAEAPRLVLTTSGWSGRRLPAVPKPWRAAVVPSETMSMAENKKIVVIDDEQSVQEVVRAYLEKDGFMVYVAGTGSEGLALAERSSRP